MSVELKTLRESIYTVFPESRIEPVSEQVLTSFQHEYRGVPQHYLEFLRHVGAGVIGDSTFTIYSAPFESEELFDEQTAVELHNILFVGDDFAGWMIGFDTHNDWQLVGVSTTYIELDILEEKTIAGFVTQLIRNLQ